MDIGSSLEERDWTLLLRRIADGKCTPLIGPGMCHGIVPRRRDMAQSWARQYDYPLPDVEDLARVTQYLAVQYDPFYPKEEIQKQLSAAEMPDFNRPEQAHAMLADLNLPIYITTGYDDFMVQALRSRHKDPRRELCRWNSVLQRSQPSMLDTGYEPTPANPLVYHLFGYYEVLESLVLTEDDHLDFLVNVTTDEFQLPPRIQRALTGSSLLLIGFNPVSWDFRILFRGLIAATESSLRRINVTVQMAPVAEGVHTATQQKVQAYLHEYFDKTETRMRIYWGTAEQFTAELRQRWQGFQSPQSVHTAPSLPQIDLMQLYQKIMSSFSKNELMTLTFALHVDHETLPEVKDAFVRELIVYMQRRKRLHELVEACQQERPHLAW
jgi:hypothetical protein